MAFADPAVNLANQGFIIEITHVPSNMNVHFNGWVTSFSDSFESNWNKEEAYGRMDPITTYQSTTRTITLEWDVVAAHFSEAKTNMGNVSKLLRMLYPSYSGGADNASNLQASPLFKFKFGNLIADPSGKGPLLGTMGGFEYSPDFDSGFFTQSPGMMYPQAITLSAEFTVLHNFPLGFDADSKNWRGQGNYPYGAGEGDAGSAEREPPPIPEGENLQAAYTYGDGTSVGGQSVPPDKATSTAAEAAARAGRDAMLGGA